MLVSELLMVCLLRSFEQNKCPVRKKSLKMAYADFNSSVLKAKFCSLDSALKSNKQTSFQTIGKNFRKTRKDKQLSQKSWFCCEFESANN